MHLMYSTMHRMNEIPPKIIATKHWLLDLLLLFQDGQSLLYITAVLDLTGITLIIEMQFCSLLDDRGGGEIASPAT